MQLNSLQKNTHTKIFFAEKGATGVESPLERGYKSKKVGYHWSNPFQYKRDKAISCPTFAFIFT